MYGKIEEYILYIYYIIYIHIHIPYIYIYKYIFYNFLSQFSAKLKQIHNEICQLEY